jgi:hypothetical protein
MMVDLKRRFGRKYKIEHEESYHAETGSTKACNRDPCLYLIPCKHGEIFPWGDSLLAISTKRRGAIATRLENLPCTKVQQDGSDGLTLTFHEDDFPTIAEIVKPKRKPQLSNKQRQAMSQRMIRLNQRRQAKKYAQEKVHDK